MYLVIYIFEKMGVTIIERETKNVEKSKKKKKKPSLETVLDCNMFYYNGTIFYCNGISWKLFLKLTRLEIDF